MNLDMTTPDRRTTVNGVELAWGVWGPPDAATIVLCHGYTGSSHDFAPHIGWLAERWRVIAMDHRGHGLSEKCGEPASYSIEQISMDVIGLLDATCREPVTILGHSLGGRVVLGVALERPDLVRSLILADTSAWSFLPEDPAIRKWIGAFFAGLDPGQGLPQGSRLPEDDLIDQVMPFEWRERKAVLSAGVDPVAVKVLGQELFDRGVVSVRDRLGELGVPSMVIVGEHDEPFVTQADAFAAELGAELVRIAGAFHSPQLTHQTAWREAIERHLTSSARR